jgi:hypothetical protein
MDIGIVQAALAFGVFTGSSVLTFLAGRKGAKTGGKEAIAQVSEKLGDPGTASMDTRFDEIQKAIEDNRKANTEGFQRNDAWCLTTDEELGRIRTRLGSLERAVKHNGGGKKGKRDLR